MKRHGSSERAFTLVELLVVIGIVAILISLLLPVVVGAKRQAQRVQCASNLKQLGIAMVLYTGEYKYFPEASFELPGGGFGSSWPVRLRKYLNRNQNVFYCPSQDSICQWKADAPGRFAFAQAIHTQFGYEIGERLLVWSNPGTYFSYGYNGLGACGAPPAPTPRGMGGLRYTNPTAPSISGGIVRQSTAMKAPAEFIMLGDTSMNGVNDLAIFPLNTIGEVGFETIVGNIHGGGANILFGDGHVQWWLQKSLTTRWLPVPEDAEKQRMWNLDNLPAQQW